MKLTIDWEAMHKESQKEIKRLDAQRMRAAVVALGAAVIGLITYIWAAVVGSMPR